MRDQRGLALPLTLMLMVALMALTMALLTYAGHEPVIARNLTDNTQARFAAETGLERALDTLRANGNWDAFVATATAQEPTVQLMTGSIGGNGAASGATYTVTVRNDIQATDAAITGVNPVDASPTDDQNGALVVTATGVAGAGAAATKVLEAAITRLTMPPYPGALSFPGNEADVSFSGNAFEVNGNGFTLDSTKDNPIPDPNCPAVFGIGVSQALPAQNPGANEAVVESALSGQQGNNVLGKPEAGGPGEGANTIQADSALTPELLAKFIDQAKQAADITLQSNQPSGLSYSGIGGSCASDPSSSTCWGYKDAEGNIHPKIVWIRGQEDPTSEFSALQLSGGAEGYGILIVEDGDLRISGNFKWNGAIIVTGKYVGVGYMGGGQQEVLGAVISNETAADPFREGVLVGNASIRYSCQALEMATKASGLTKMKSWKEIPGQ
jgi:Tfp pilus assembly protein PilX